jgi:hypothetical protein
MVNVAWRSPDYRNNLDIANAISTFGKYHHWNNQDPLKARVLVYASFPSIASVPRDVVFGKFGTVGGVRESWTAVVYILTAEFADALPADEDQMPLDGNPHPLPGQLLNNLNLNMFVMPPFPEIGWNELPENLANDLHQGGNDHVQQGDAEQPFLQQVEDQNSMVINPSAQPDSSSDGNMQGNNAAVDQINLDLNLALGPLMGLPQAQDDAIQVGFVLTFVGPVLPPEMQWKRTFELMLPAMLTKNVLESMNFAALSDIVLSKRVWHVSLDKQLGYQVTFADKIPLEEDSDSQTFRLSLEKTQECFSDSSDLSVAMTRTSFVDEQTDVSSHNVISMTSPKKRGRPRKNPNLSPSKVI